ncbi:AmmeMemoRadiSam system protein A [Ruminococcaceae bacterium OttesenSCG-928-O06]|nr:AmmeMemoRadiSam system protein A [Ruminococcaceae bacterium OttesenSCG-928-O06]
MPIVAAVAVPHPPILHPLVGQGEEAKIHATQAAYQTAMRFVAAAQPQTVVVITSHANAYSDWFEISPGSGAAGNLSRFGAPGAKTHVPYNEAFAAAIEAEAMAKGVPAGCTGRPNAPLDHGATIPLLFLQQEYTGYQVVRIGISGLGAAQHYALGACIAAAAGDAPVAVIASGDLSHKLREDGPYGFAPEGPVLDEEITTALAEGDFARLMAIDPRLAQKGAECGLRCFVMMAGCLDGRAVDARLLSYEGTFGVGYAVATFAPGAPDDTRRFLAKAQQQDALRLAARKAAEDPFVRLARASIAGYLAGGARSALPPAPLPDALPDELTTTRAGVFVSLHKGGALRGCIGTIAPTCESTAAEIWQNAVSAAVEDPRFEPLQPEELDTLEISVDVLQPPEDIASPALLDPQKYGVIVSHAGRRGLLLPALEGVDTAEEQIDIARRKAGIAPNAPFTLQRFLVVRHE